MVNVVVISSAAKKSLRRCPHHVVRNFMAWVGSVQTVGLQRTRLVPGYHDEPLKGAWAGYRSIRLSKAYRAIYSLRDDDVVEFALVESVTKHKY